MKHSHLINSLACNLAYELADKDSRDRSYTFDLEVYLTLDIVNGSNKRNIIDVSNLLNDSLMLQGGAIKIHTGKLILAIAEDYCCETPNDSEAARIAHDLNRLILNGELLDNMSTRARLLSIILAEELTGEQP